MRTRTNLAVIATGLFFILGAITSAFGQYALVGSVATEIGNLTRSETTVQDGVLPIEQFKIVRLAKTGLAPQDSKAVIFLLPSAGVEFTSYEQAEPQTNTGASIAGFFAKRNFVVYGYSSRAEGIPAGACELGAIDCSPMAGWDLQTMLDDIAFARNVIDADDPELSVFVGGFSMGAIAAVAAINEAPGDYAGAIIWEGALFSTDIQVQALNQGYCAGLQAQLGAGIVFDGLGNNMIKKIAKLAQVQPSGLTAIPLFPSFLTNHQVLVGSLTAPAPTPFSMPVPGYVLVNGDLASDQFYYASEQRLLENISRFNDYLPLATVRDVSCSLAGVETSFTSNLINFDGPILGIGGGLSFGPYMLETLELTGSSDITMMIEPDFGHVDHFVSENHQDLVEKPILEWIKQYL